MTRRIKVLDNYIANRIAAGEVVERPASVVKELVENAIDAGATSIVIETRNGGLDYIRVTDNGCGIPAEEAVIAFARHATSKIDRAEDLEEIGTLGFRGEALASIAAVSEVTMRSCEPGAEAGILVRMAGGECRENTACGCPVGTTFEVEHLFYNVPARLKFMKSSRTETGYITDYTARMLMAYPRVAFKLIQNGRTVYQSTGDGELKNAIFTVYGAEVLPHIKPVFRDDGYIRLTGFAGTERIARNNRLAQSFFVNSRYIKSQRLSFAAQLAYDTRMMVGKFPFITLDIRINGREVDPNVHPNKLEIRFKDEDRVLHAVTQSLREALVDSIREIPELQRQDVELPQSSAWHTSAASISSAKGMGQGATAMPAPEPIRIAASEALNAQSLPPKTILREALEERPIMEQAEPTVPYVAVFTQPKPPEAPTCLHEEAAEPTRMAAMEGEFRVIGQLFACYWVIEQGDTVFFIDQHAAHERLLYEKFMERGLEARSQILLLPQALRLSPQEYDTLMDNLAALREIGFDIEEFGPMTVSVRAVPYMIGAPETAAYLREVLNLLQSKNRFNAAELKRDALIQSACKHAVKAGDRLTEAEIRALLTEYGERGIPMTCPHGRPVMLKMKRTEFEKLFKRSV